MEFKTLEDLGIESNLGGKVDKINSMYLNFEKKRDFFFSFYPAEKADKK